MHNNNIENLRLAPIALVSATSLIDAAIRNSGVPNKDFYQEAEKIYNDMMAFITIGSSGIKEGAMMKVAELLCLTVASSCVNKFEKMKRERHHANHAEIGQNFAAMIAFINILVQGCAAIFIDNEAFFIDKPTKKKISTEEFVIQVKVLLANIKSLSDSVDNEPK